MNKARQVPNKQLEELQAKYEGQVQQCSDLSNRFDATEKDLKQTSELLANTENELRQCKYSLKERDFIISEQKKAAEHESDENALRENHYQPPYTEHPIDEPSVARNNHGLTPETSDGNNTQVLTSTTPRRSTRQKNAP
ncbi:unnamed protein product [Fraxinus pennsylvanica]|uniref:Uncharacterized protein n=1 Tax=Fraxinus pennsylvanica TaxID=56036 RepID=A0AAD2A5K0_9LAMI|nr:unnamed protein product [Fraxinus pennsylvanica]